MSVDVWDSTFPETMRLWDLTTGDSWEVQFNPADLDEELAAEYAHLGVLGMSHEELQFSRTKNLAQTITLAVKSRTRAYGAEDVVKARAWLQSLVYPPRGAKDVPTGGPPDVLVTWGDWLSLTIRVQKLKFKLNRWDRQGRLTGFTVEMTWEEHRVKRLTLEEVRASGTVR